MKAMVLRKLSNLEHEDSPLEIDELPIPHPQAGEMLVRVSACAVCHTELDEIEGRTPPPLLPVVPGHQVVGTVMEMGPGAHGVSPGARVVVAWIFSACGKCPYCQDGRENLCPEFIATGRDVNGGYAEYVVVPAAFVHHIPAPFSDIEAAPLLCAGAIGYRSLRLTGIHDGGRLGLTRLGPSAHRVLKLVRHQFPSTRVFVFARSEQENAFARSLGAVWTGDTEEKSPERLHSIIDTTPAWKPVLEALTNLEPGGRLVINAIRKEERDKDQLQRLDYPGHLWMEKEIKSVENVTRTDVRRFLEIASAIPVKPEVQEFALEEANIALLQLKARKIRGAKVLKL